MIAIAVSAPLEREDAIVREAARHGHRVVVRAATAADLVERLVALADDAAELARAQTLGLDTVAWADGFAAVEAAAVPATGAAAQAERPRGRIVVVWGPAGAPGRTTAAIALAAELAGLGQRVALVDADTTAAAVAPALGLLDESPGFAAAARLARAGSLTVDELDRIAQLVPSSVGVVRVLTGIGRASRWPELGGDRVAEVLARCRDWTDVTVVDVAASLERDEEISSDLFAPRRNGATIAALEAADEVVVVAGGDPVGVARLVRALPELRDIAPRARVRVVVNKVRQGATGVAPERAVHETLRRLAQITPEACWPFDARAADAALLEGRPLLDVAGRSRLRRRVLELAAALVPQQQEVSRASLRAAERPRRSWLAALR